MRPKTAAEATEVHKHCSRTRVQKVNREVRRKMKAAREVWIQVQCKNIEKGIIAREHQGGLQHPQGSHQDLTA